jgi:hypothetical protein
MCIDRIACVTREFSMFRSHINTVSADNPCVTREFSMFRTDRSIVSPEFRIFRTHTRIVIDRIACVTREFSRSWRNWAIELDQLSIGGG